VEFTVGRHAAHDGAGVHPIVAAALQRQVPESARARRHGYAQAVGQVAVAEGDQVREGGLGWPGKRHDGTGLGWPVDVRSDAPVPAVPEPLTVVPAQPAKRRLGWRRLFGGAQATDRAPEGSSAA
jgi:hypothetical protein